MQFVVRSYKTAPTSSYSCDLPLESIVLQVLSAKSLAYASVF